MGFTDFTATADEEPEASVPDASDNGAGSSANAPDRMHYLARSRSPSLRTTRSSMQPVSWRQIVGQPQAMAPVPQSQASGSDWWHQPATPSPDRVIPFTPPEAPESPTREPWSESPTQSEAPGGGAGAGHSAIVP